jgi:hypothetical protein
LILPTLIRFLFVDHVPRRVAVDVGSGRRRIEVARREAGRWADTEGACGEVDDYPGIPGSASRTGPIPRIAVFVSPYLSLPVPALGPTRRHG